jgi:Fe-S cluster assembly iron-binding protein IscA
MHSHCPLPCPTAPRGGSPISQRDPAHRWLAVTGGGCSAFRYNFALDDAQLDERTGGGKARRQVLIDPVSLDFLAGAEIDFTDDLIGRGFRSTIPTPPLPAAAAPASPSDVKLD